VAVVFAIAVYREWSFKNTPQPALNAAASQTPAPAASQPPIPGAGETNNVQPQAKAAAAPIGGASALTTDNATLHGQTLHREGSAIHMQDFDVTLDGRTLTATEGIYHPDTGIVDLTGKVQLHFGPNARTSLGEVK
jgi:hypothetical protein